LQQNTSVPLISTDIYVTKSVPSTGGTEEK